MAQHPHPQSPGTYHCPAHLLSLQPEHYQFNVPLNAVINLLNPTLEIITSAIAALDAVPVVASGAEAAAVSGADGGVAPAGSA
ncbi:hypothetical protein [Andreprevotia chitinilytica]|uniref:hypothetical protein n=1 Tax=Andreprevotia chitinilytica TaxID=396808 RepID=UPI00055507E4|nr:hypothetical protein [Andreprevotia chitinilytica]